MAGVRGVARWGTVVFAALFLVGVVVQFLLAGFALFGEMSWDTHADIGFGPVHLVSLLVFLAALVAWTSRPDVGLGFLVFALTTVQVNLPAAGSGWVAGFHPLIALVLFVLGHVVLRRGLRAVR